MTRTISFGPLVDPTSMSLSLMAQTMDSGWITEGEQVRLFEQEFAAKFGFKYAVMTSSGTTAGIVAWSAIRERCGVKWGEGGVLTPACAFVATGSCILSAGLTPIFVDINLDTLNMDFNPRAQQIVTLEPIGIQFVANMGKLEGVYVWKSWAKKNHKTLLIDACEAHGAQINGQQISDLCDIAIYSCYTAHMVVAGEGGFICTNNDEIADLCRSIKSHGRPIGENFFSFDRLGINAKSTDLAASIGRASLARFEKTFERRREVRARMLDRLAVLEERGKVILYNDRNEIVAPHAFPLVFKNKADTYRKLSPALDAAGIAWKTLFGCLPVQHSAFGHLGYRWGDFPIAEHVGRAGIHWGTHEGMTNDDVDYLCDVVLKALA